VLAAPRASVASCGFVVPRVRSTWCRCEGTVDSMHSSLSLVGEDLRSCCLGEDLSAWRRLSVSYCRRLFMMAPRLIWSWGRSDDVIGESSYHWSQQVAPTALICRNLKPLCTQGHLILCDTVEASSKSKSLLCVSEELQL